MSLGINNRYSASVERVISGDDLILLVDLGIDNLYKRVRARLYGVDAPDSYKSSGAESDKVRKEVLDLVQHGKSSIILRGVSKGGWIIELFVEKKDDSVINVNSHLVSMGYIYDRGVQLCLTEAQ